MAPFFSATDIGEVALLLGLAGWPFSSSKYSDSRLLTDVAVFSYDRETSKVSNICY